MKVSIIITALDSQEIVRRQLLYLDRMPLPEGVEVVLIDDGSIPPIEVENVSFPLTSYRTNDFRPWTQAAARMKGINLSEGEKLICVDIDHVVTEGLIRFVMNSDYDFIKFKSKLAVLDEYGQLQSDRDSLMKYGVPLARLKRRGLNVCPPGNCYAASKDLLLKLSAKPKNHKLRLQHLLNMLKRKNEVSTCKGSERPLVYVIPNGRFCGDVDTNPFGLFHGLSRTMQEYRNDYWIQETA